MNDSLKWSQLFKYRFLFWFFKVKIEVGIKSKEVALAPWFLRFGKLFKAHGFGRSGWHSRRAWRIPYLMFNDPNHKLIQYLNKYIFSLTLKFISSDCLTIFIHFIPILEFKYIWFCTEVYTEIFNYYIKYLSISPSIFQNKIFCIMNISVYLL